jgi:hypothetical protein
MSVEFPTKGKNLYGWKVRYGTVSPRCAQCFRPVGTTMRILAFTILAVRTCAHAQRNAALSARSSEVTRLFRFSRLWPCRPQRVAIARYHTRPRFTEITVYWSSMISCTRRQWLGTSLPPHEASSLACSSAVRTSILSPPLLVNNWLLSARLRTAALVSAQWTVANPSPRLTLQTIRSRT